ncbi:hypothetical protein ABEG18_17865 [Alsobacter sp. KACC 23698]|uniref:Uncharacterized protein n=1 Tax=Alsobacter sp. KACC 23698 TaxID=3149229 RepID=A0AAU7JBQ3_9HYPH
MDEILLDRSSLDRLINTYEDLRIHRGLGTALNRVTPGQRLDALHICLAVTAGGIAAGSATRSFWLRHLAPVLAETRESATALEEALDVTFRSRGAPQADPRERFLVVAKRWLAREFGWVATRQMAVVAALAAAVVCAGYLLSPRPPDPVIVHPPPPFPVSPSLQPLGQQIPPDSSPLTRSYVKILTVAVASLSEHKDASPQTLARAMSASFPQAGKPAQLLSEMVSRFPLSPDQPIPHTAAGGLAVRHYALVVAERLTPGSFDDMAALLSIGERAADTEVAKFLAAFQAENANAAPTASPPAASGRTTYRYLPFLVLLLGSVWALQKPNRPPSASSAARKREVAIALRDQCRAAAGSWAEASLVQTGTAGLPPLPSAGRVVRALLGFREPRPGTRLDAGRSVRATLQSAGDLVPVLQARSSAVEFVFLIRRRHRHDHERARALRLVNALGDAGLALTAYDYAPDPRRLTATSRVRGSNARHGTTLDLRGLRERHFGAVLVLITDGDELLDLLTGRPLEVVTQDIANWPRRMILTPTPVAAWGIREYRLAVALDSPIGRASLAGFADLALVFDDRFPDYTARRPLVTALELPNLGRQVERWTSLMVKSLTDDLMPAPPPVLVADEMILLSERAPSQQAIDTVVLALREWLGRGYVWFLACAVHPQLRFDVTLWLGANLTRKVVPGSFLTLADAEPRADPPRLDRAYSDAPLFSEAQLDRLCQLVWFRQGRMPAWLRIAAFDNARDRDKASARAAVERLLQRTKPGEMGSVTSLPVWLPDWRGQKLAADETMLGLKSDFPLIAVSELTPMISQKRWYSLALARFSMLLAWATIASWLVPGADVPTPNGAWLPLAAYVVATFCCCALLVIPAVRAAPGRMLRAMSSPEAVTAASAERVAK